MFKQRQSLHIAFSQQPRFTTVGQNRVNQVSVHDKSPCTYSSWAYRGSFQRSSYWPRGGCQNRKLLIVRFSEIPVGLGAHQWMVTAKWNWRVNRFKPKRRQLFSLQVGSINCLNLLCLSRVEIYSVVGCPIRTVGWLDFRSKFIYWSAMMEGEQTGTTCIEPFFIRMCNTVCIFSSSHSMLGPSWTKETWGL